MDSFSGSNLLRIESLSTAHPKKRNHTRNQCTLIKSVVGALNQPKIRKPLGLRIYTYYLFCALNSLEVQNLIQRSLFKKVLVHLKKIQCQYKGKLVVL